MTIPVNPSLSLYLQRNITSASNQRVLVCHWESSMFRNSNKETRTGCSAKGSISYIFLSCLNSQPLD